MGKLHLGIYLGPEGAVALCDEFQVLVVKEEHALKRSVLRDEISTHENIQSLPRDSIRYCLNRIGAQWSDIASITALSPDGRLDALRSELFIGTDPRISSAPDLHQAQALHCYLQSGFEESLIFVLDHRGPIHHEERTAPQRISYTLYHARGVTLHPLHEHAINVHLERYATLTSTYLELARRAKLCLEDEVSESELISWWSELASFGSPQPNLRPWFSAHPSELDLTPSSYDLWLEVNLIELWSHRRDQIEQSGRGEQRIQMKRMWADLAHKAQREVSAALCQLARLAIERSGSRHLCLTGPLALDPMIATRFAQFSDLDRVYIPPMPSNIGIAIGCAFSTTLKTTPYSPAPPQYDLHIGPPYKPAQIQHALAAFGGILTLETMETLEMEQRFAREIAQGKLIARYEGVPSLSQNGSGARALLIDPTAAHAIEGLYRDPSTQDTLPRPFIICPEGQCALHFTDVTSSPFGHLLATPTPALATRISGVLRHDGRVRLLTITEESDLQLSRLCESLSEHFDRPPLLLAAPFKNRDYRELESPSEAAHWLIGGDVDALICGSFWLKKRPKYINKRSIRNRPIQALLRVPHTLLPPLQDELQRLDQLLFNPRGVSNDWSYDKLEEISREFAPYRSMSHLFTEHPLHPRFVPALSPSVTACLNPRGKSQLFDDRDRWPARLYDWPEMITLVSLLFDKKSQRESLQAQLKRPHPRVRSMIDWAIAELESYGLSSSPSWQTPPLAGALIEQTSDPLLAPFKDPHFSLRGPLAQLWRTLREGGYTEEAISPHRDGLPRPLGDGVTADLLRLFWLNIPLERDRIVQALGADLVQDLSQLGLLKAREKWTSRVKIDCLQEVYLATDFERRLDVHAQEPLCRPLSALQRGIVSLSVGMRGGRTLDLSDTYAAVAIILARGDDPVTVVVRNERALRLAHFNLQLNGIESYTLSLGDEFEGLPGSPYDNIFTATTQPFRTLGAHLRKGGRLVFFHEEISIVRGALIPLSGHSLTLSLIGDPIPYFDPRLYQGFASRSGYWIFEYSDHPEHLKQPTFHRPLLTPPTGALGSYVEHFFSLKHLDDHLSAPHPTLSLFKVSRAGRPIEYQATNEGWPSLSPIILSDEVYAHMKALIAQRQTAPVSPVSATLARLGLKVTHGSSTS
jgi:predicted NodU family carbamoyl transferase